MASLFKTLPVLDADNRISALRRNWFRS